VGTRGLKPTAAKKSSPLKRTETRVRPPCHPEKGGEKQVFGVFSAASTPKLPKCPCSFLQSPLPPPYTEYSDMPIGTLAYVARGTVPVAKVPRNPHPQPLSHEIGRGEPPTPLMHPSYESLLRITHLPHWDDDLRILGLCE
jgi:hypothetical protein